MASLVCFAALRQHISLSRHRGGGRALRRRSPAARRGRRTYACARQSRAGAAFRCRSPTCAGASRTASRSPSWRSARRRPRAPARARRQAPIRAGSRPSCRPLSRRRHHGDQPRRQRRRGGRHAGALRSTASPSDKPDVVLWQVGTNAVLRDNPLGPVDRLMHEGLGRMKALGADVVLIDPQFAPKVIVQARRRRHGERDRCGSDAGAASTCFRASPSCGNGTSASTCRSRPSCRRTCST